MGLAIELLAGSALLLVALVALALIDQRRAGRASELLRSTADELGAMPIASMRNGAQIVLSRRDCSTSDTPFTMLSAGESRPLSAEEVRHLWRWGRLWWYHTGETPPLGLQYYLRYLDGHYASVCQCSHRPDPGVPGASDGDTEPRSTAEKPPSALD